VTTRGSTLFLIENKRRSETWAPQTSQNTHTKRDRASSINLYFYYVFFMYFQKETKIAKMGF
jgi:hypothetical protein